MNALPENDANKSKRYAIAAISMHWVIGLLVVGMLVLGYYMAGIPKGVPDRALYFNLHKSFGVLAGVLILARLGWRLTHAVPPVPVDMPRWTAAAARWSHRLLYIFMVLQPATGYLSSSFNKYGIKFFGLALPAWAWEDKQWRDLLMNLHKSIFSIKVKYDTSI